MVQTLRGGRIPVGVGGGGTWRCCGEDGRHNADRRALRGLVVGSRPGAFTNWSMNGFCKCEGVPVPQGCGSSTPDEGSGAPGVGVGPGDETENNSGRAVTSSGLVPT